jgi:hypothetical protein
MVFPTFALLTPNTVFPDQHILLLEAIYQRRQRHLLPIHRRHQAHNTSWRDHVGFEILSSAPKCGTLTPLPGLGCSGCCCWFLLQGSRTTVDPTLPPNLLLSPETCQSIPLLFWKLVWFPLLATTEPSSTNAQQLPCRQAIWCAGGPRSWWRLRFLGFGYISVSSAWPWAPLSLRLIREIVMVLTCHCVDSMD